MNEITGFTFFKSYYDCLKELDPNDKKEILNAIIEYVFDDTKPSFIGVKKSIWILIEPHLSTSKTRSYAGKSKLNQNEIKKEPKKESSFLDDLHIHISYIINYLNNKLNSNYKYNSKYTVERIKARLNEGFKDEDFISVIDKKYNEWKGTEFEKFLRPETLFGTKFESYLNQKSTNKNPEWYGKDIKKQEMSEEEERILRKELEEFN